MTNTAPAPTAPYVWVRHETAARAVLAATRLTAKYGFGFAVTPEHDCGICDGPLTFDGMSEQYPTFVCAACDAWHIAKDCCHGFARLPEPRHASMHVAPTLNEER